MDEHGFEARLRHVEHILVGQQPMYLARATKLPLLQRMDALRKELQIVYKGNKGIQDFIDKYDVHAKLLNPANSTFLMEREFIAPEAKLELVMAGLEDMETFAKQVKQVKALEHVVSGVDFEVVKSLGPELAPLEAIHSDQARELNELTHKVSSLMDNYNGLINTLSEIFISWDDILGTMESHVSALERKKEAV
ncbi:hypothetical protein CLU79DRAFT_754028 [Phycomyces nitens]|nr:hypothetical protein CLU79DRAFT_754028 [Phycomyces nitens]